MKNFDLLHNCKLCKTIDFNKLESDTRATLLGYIQNLTTTTNSMAQEILQNVQNHAKSDLTSNQKSTIIDDVQKFTHALFDISLSRKMISKIYKVSHDWLQDFETDQNKLARSLARINCATTSEEVKSLMDTYAPDRKTKNEAIANISNLKEANISMHASNFAKRTHQDSNNLTSDILFILENYSDGIFTAEKQEQVFYKKYFVGRFITYCNKEDLNSTINDIASLCIKLPRKQGKPQFDILDKQIANTKNKIHNKEYTK